MAKSFNHPELTAMPAIHQTKIKRDMKFFSFTSGSSDSRMEVASEDEMLSHSLS